mmetsp:Transcript_5639/g.8390  ORF Transcript_5639/g.8390 Transcript_5639/m.8390 type:complete len:357 (-) Transcript_5639:257-1327(-)
MMNSVRGNTARITVAMCLLSSTCHAFSIVSSQTFVKPQNSILHRNTGKNSASTLNMIRAPPGSGYAGPEEEVSHYPDTYDPMMEYPGTMRPGNTHENQPFTSLPIQESDPDPVPWPHFQEIEWHHNWGSPHEHPIPMEEFIDMNDRWATAEMEAEMRAGARRGVRERRELEEAQKAASFILDDDEEDDEDDEVKLDLGQGVEAFIGTDKIKVEADVTEEEIDESGDDDDDDDGADDMSLDYAPAETTQVVAAKEEEKPSFQDEIIAMEVGEEPKEKAARIMIRMPDGKRLVRKFNLDDTVKMIYAFVAQSNEDAKNGKEFELKAGFPPKNLLGSIDESIASTGLAGDNITVRWKED